jgi:PAS domain S-box-containing protein
LLILVIGVIPPVRLMRVSSSYQRENLWMAMGFIFVVLFSLIDFLAVSFNLAWIRLSDYSYLPIAIVFNYIQVQRFGQLYMNMDAKVRERTADLRQANEALQAEITEHRQAEEEIHTYAETMTALYETTRDLVSERDVSKLLHTIVERAARLLNASSGGMYLCELEQHQVRCVVSYNTPHDFTGTVLQYGEGAAGRVAETGEPFIIDDYPTWEGRAAVYEETRPFQAVLSVPMKWQDEIIGVLHVLEYGRKRHFTEDDLKLVMSFANHAASAVQNARLYTQIQQELAERKQAEFRLLESRAQLSGIIESAMDGIITIDSDQRILLFNAASEKIFGCSAAEAVGQPIDRFIPTRYRDFHREQILRFGETNVTSRSMETQFPITGLRVDGMEFPIEASISQIEVNGQKLYTVIHRDITHRLQTEVALRESEEKYRTLVERANDGIAIIQNGSVKYLNLRLAEMRGESVEEIIGRRFNTYIHPDERAKILEFYRRRMAGENIPSTYEVVLLRNDNTKLFAEISAGIIAYDGKPADLVIVRDITQRKQIEKALQESEARFRGAIESAGAVPYSHDYKTNTYSFMGDGIFSLTGYSAQEITPTLYGSLERETRMLGKVSHLTVSEASKLMRAGKLSNWLCDSLVIAKDGTKRWIADVSVPIFSEAGDVTGSIGILQDITERKQAEEYLRTAEAKYRMLAEQIPAIVYTAGADQFIGTTYISPQIRILGFTQEEWISDPQLWLRQMHPEDRERVMAEIEEMKMGRKTFQAEYRLITRDGQVKWFYDEALHIRDIDGTPLFLQGFMLDITERKKAENSLRESEERYRNIYETSTIGMYRTTPDGKILMNNPALLRMLGYNSFEELSHRNLEQEGYEAGYTRHEFRQRIESEGDVLGLESAWKRKDGTTVFVRESAKVIRDVDGKILYYEGTVEDITERKRAEEKILRQNKRLKVLREIDTAILAADSVENIVGAALDHVRELIECRRAHISLFDWGTNEALVFDVRTIGDTSTPKGTRFPLATIQDNIKILSQNQLVLVNDLSAWADPPPLIQSLIQDGLRSMCLLPLVSQSKLIASFSLLSEIPAFFDEDKINLGREVANQVAIAIENSRLLNETRQRADEFAALYEITRDLSGEQDVNSLLSLIVERAVHLLGSYGGAMYLYDASQNKLEMTVAFNDPKGMHQRVPLGEGASGHVAQTGTPLVIDDYQTWEERRALLQNVPYRALVVVPMSYRGRLIGVLDVFEFGESTRKFSERDVKLLSLFATHAVGVVHSARLFEAEQHRRQEISAIADVGRDISTSLQLDVVLEKIAAHAMNLLRTESSAVYLAEPATSTLRAVVAIGPDAEEIKNDALEIGEGVLGNIVMRGLGEIANDTAADPRAVTIKGTEITAFEHLMGVPVLSKNRLIGLIAVWRIGAGQEFQPPELDFLGSLAGQVAVAIENARLFEETQQRLREMEGLAQVGEAISQNIELEPLLTRILDVACETIPAAEKGSILLLEDHNALGIYALSGYADPRTRAVRFSTDTGYASLAVRQKRGILVSDVWADASITLNVDIPEMNEIQSAMVAPLMVNQRVIGTISLDNASRKSAFTEDDLRVLVALATPAALAIDNARLFKETRRRLSDLEILQTISTALRVAKTLDEALPIILDQLIKLLEVDSALLDIIDPSSREIVTELAHGIWSPMTGMRSPGNIGGSGHVISTGQPYVSNDLIADGLVAYPDMLRGLIAGACVPIVAQHQPIGALWVGRKTAITEEEVTLLTTLGEMVGNTIRRMSLSEQTKRLLEDLQASNMELIQAYDTTLEGWARALELRDRETEGHTRRVTETTLRLAKYIGVSDTELVNMQRGALLHDIGKMAVPDHILKKTGMLTESEWEEMRKHPQYAYNMLSSISYLHAAIDIPYCHHEHWDGSGYPRGLKGEQIPRSARIFSIVDIWDALLSDRPYRKAWPRNKVIEYIQGNAGTILDPLVTEIFLKMIDEEYKLEPKLSAE